MMFLYTLRVLETPFYEPIVGQYLDKDLALKAADAALPHCVGDVIVEESPIAESVSITPPRQDKYVNSIERNRIYQKTGTRKLTNSQQAARLRLFF